MLALLPGWFLVFTVVVTTLELLNMLEVVYEYVRSEPGGSIRTNIAVRGTGVRLPGHEPGRSVTYRRDRGVLSIGVLAAGRAHAPLQLHDMQQRLRNVLDKHEDHSAVEWP